MFVLTVEARAIHPDALRRLFLAWPGDVGPSATGWLGNSGGVSADGEFILLMRFVSQEAAWITNDLPDSGRWWQACRRHLEAPPAFSESVRVTGILNGGSDEAAAVRITRGSASPTRLRDSLRQLESLTMTERAAVIGGIVAWHDGERLTEALYLGSKVAQFRTVATPSTPVGRFIADHEAAVRGRQVIDLDEPWLTSPARPDTREAR